jgi:hypothetical protein
MTLVTVLMRLSRPEEGLGRSLKGAVEGATATEQRRATRSMQFCGPRQYRVCIARPDKRRTIGNRRGRAGNREREIVVRRSSTPVPATAAMRNSHRGGYGDEELYNGIQDTFAN